MARTCRAAIINLGFALACCGVLWGCQASDDSGGGQAPCIVGQTVQCNCVDGAIGTASCTELGMPGVCMCMPGAAGMMSGGLGGAAGTIIGGAGGVGAGPVGGASGAAGMMSSGGMGGLAGGVGGVGGMVVTGGAGGVGGMVMTGGVGGMMTTGGMGGGTGEEVPPGATCQDAATWMPTWTEFEDEVLRLTNEARAAGHNCDSEGNFGPTEPLTMSAILRCSSRLHSLDMGEGDYFDHTARDGRDPFERMQDAGYMGFTMGENIAKGQQSPSDVVQGWLESDGHCANIMNPDYTEIGVGYWEGEPANMFYNGNKLWTQNFGAPRDGDCPWCN